MSAETRPKTRASRKASRVACDLFAGAGGATEGLASAGFDVRVAVELDPVAASTFRRNHADVTLLERDIRDVTVDELLDTLALPVGGLDLLKACPPCQGFSSLGKGNRDDPRNDLVTEMWRFIDGLRPKSFLFENVPGLNKDRRLDDLVERAQAAGYGVRRLVVDAADYGVPQRRRRLIVIGVLGLASEDIDEDLGELLPEDFDRSRATAGPVILQAGPIEGTSDPLHRARRPSSLVRRRLEAIPVGGDRFSLPEDLRLDCHSTVGRSATAAYGRILADQPAPTLTTRCTTPACGRFIHPTEPRGISLREAALLQTFPARYAFDGGHQEVERQIGNAVPVRLALALGLAMQTLVDLAEMRAAR